VTAQVTHSVPASSGVQEQAIRKGKSYLRYQAFSRFRLIAQPRYEEFTASQARYGVDAVGLR
jgi:hypothetical protein